MKAIAVALLAGCCSLFADTLVFNSGRTLSGTIIQTNGDDVALLTKFGTYNFARSNLKEIKIDQPEMVEVPKATRLPDAKTFVLHLSRQAWAANLSQIPAIVIDKGPLKNVPYVSYRCGEDYEVNIYGDQTAPAGIEAGIYRRLLDDESAKKNCMKLLRDLLGQAVDREVLNALKLEKDQKTVEGLTFEITPPTDEDAYLGWWVSIYSEKKLDAARASDAEMNRLAIAKDEAAKQPEAGGWSSQDLKLARSEPERISFTTGTGNVVKNALVKPYVEGVSLIWRDENGSGGVVKLADLPKELQARFRYNPGRAVTQEETDKEKEARDAQERAAWLAQAAQVAQTPTALTPQQPQTSTANYVPATTSHSGGRVWVRPYVRRDGTPVSGHYRSR